MKRSLKYFLVMLLPLAVLLVRPLTPAAVLAFGQEIRLDTEPVDPRDIFRGDYVTLRFAIERADEKLMNSDELEAFYDVRRYSENAFGAPRAYLYVTLEPDKDGMWQAVKISVTPPETGVYLRAGAEYHYYFDGDIRRYNFELDYGDYLRRYYVKENTGMALEDAARRGEVAAVAKAWRGRVVLTGVEMK